MPTSKLPNEEYISDAHLREVGLVILEWASVEILLTQALYELATLHKPSDSSKDATPLSLAIGMDARTKIGLLKSLGKLRFGQDDEFEKALEAIESTSKKRNWFAHPFGFGKSNKPGKIRLTSAKAVGKLVSVEREFTVKGIHTIALEIHETGANLIRRLQKHGFLSPPFPGRPE